MLLLTSVNDRLQIVTSAAAAIDVHASWVDTAAGVVTPGRTNTSIITAATTSVAGAPAASTQRNIKTLHVRNKHASLSCDITVQHTDGTIVAQLYKATLVAGSMLEYTDQAGFGGGRVAPIVGGTPQRTVLLSGTGVYTTPVGATWIDVEMVGGGGGGSSGLLSTPNAGITGGNTTFGALAANGGSGGFSGSAAGGTASGGDINLQGGVGSGSGNLADGTTFASGSGGGNSFFGGAGGGFYNAAGSIASANTGSGGGGGGTNVANLAGGGYGGSSGGYCRKLITAPAATYNYAVGAGGAGGAVIGNNYAGGAGAAGMIIVTAYFQ